MIGGLIIAGNGSTKVLLRGIGPSLSAFGITNPLADPKLELHNAQGAKIAENNDWHTATNASDIQATGLAPTNPRRISDSDDATAGNYTAILSELEACRPA